VDLSFATKKRQPDCPGPSEARPVLLPFRIAARTLWSLRRRLVRFATPLERRLALPDLPPLPRSADGYLVTGLRQDLEPDLKSMHPQLRLFVRNRYARHYASLQGGFDAYLSGFSAKSRSTLKRKCRKLAERSGGTLDFRCYSRPDQIEEFYRLARAVSATTYQEKLLGTGLPEGEAALADMLSLAARGAMRGWLLFLDGVPISYLYAPASGDTLVYAYLGYDPAFADFSPGTVLQHEAMRDLMNEGRFRVFDFTEGEGQHKRQFATGSVDCVDLLLLRPTLVNLAIGHSLTGFDTAVAAAKSAVAALGLTKLARAARR
jgi:CelD/BcsL family acetyltransferase involved in cellulose biosynthesis